MSHQTQRFPMKRLWGMSGIACILSGCNALFYYPNQFVYSIPHQYHLSYESVEFESTDGTRLHGWFLPALDSKKAKGTVIQFHGNAENMTSHYRSLVWLPHHGYNVFAFDYRGFGKSGGAPELYGAVHDSIVAIAYARKRFKKEGGKLILLGQSIGGALAIAAAAQAPQEDIAAVVVEGSFSSYQRIARDKLGGVFLTWALQWPLSLIFVRDTYSPEDWVSHLSPIPVLFIHGTADPVVPYYHAQILYKAAKAPKFLWTIEEGAHIQAFTVHGNTYRQKLLDFLQEWVKD